jgi:putative acetyltransferase
MDDRVIIRAETPADYAAIRNVLVSAFGGVMEANLVEALRLEGAISTALVAAIAGEVCGHIIMSRLCVPSSGLALAPVAVAPVWQREGIGSALILKAIDLAKADSGSDIIFVLGDPAYYRRFGFSTDVAAPFQSPYAGPYFMALRLAEQAVVSGIVAYPAAFDSLD